MKKEIIELNGKKYIEFDPNKKELKEPIKTDHVIVIAQRGWIFEGHRNNSVKDKLQILNANVVRSWSNSKGIGGLCKTQYKKDYTLDEVGTISFAHEGVIAIIDIIEW